MPLVLTATTVPGVATWVDSASLGGWTLIADPGNGNTIPDIGGNGQCVINVSGPGETRLIASPTRLGQKLALTCRGANTVAVVFPYPIVSGGPTVVTLNSSTPNGYTALFVAVIANLNLPGDYATGLVYRQINLGVA